MRLPALAAAFGLLALTALPSLAAPRSAHDDCNSPDLARNIAGCARIAGDTSESAKVRAIAFVGLGLAWKEKGDPEKALAAFDAAIRLNPKDAHAYNNRAILWRDRNAVDRAIADFDAAIRIDPVPRSDIAAGGVLNIHSNRGLAWQAKGDHARARADFDEAIRRVPDDAEAHFRRARLFVEMNDAEHALADLDAAIRLAPDAPVAYYWRGVLRYQQYMYAGGWIEKGDLTGAIADFTESLKRMPDFAQGFYMRGLAHNTNGDRERAIADLAEAVRLNPLQPDMIAALKALKPDAAVATDGFLPFPPKK
ncbi:MAG: tetratricopeptide repeat protein [Pseudorhodoplanes sp.]